MELLPFKCHFESTCSCCFFVYIQSKATHYRQLSAKYGAKTKCIIFFLNYMKLGKYFVNHFNIDYIYINQPSLLSFVV